jgi:predicted dehydrogenase
MLTILGVNILAKRSFGIGIVGAGAISAAYLENLTRFPDVSVVIVGDLVPANAERRAQEFQLPAFGTSEDVLAREDVDLVVNLTIPAVHAEISSAALTAGKHVWSEKPIGVTREQGTALVEQARDAGLRLGIAPDTVLGPGMQSVRRLIEEGTIGQLLSAQTLMQTAGPQRGHPNPEFLFQPGAGPLFDFGPYYFTALATLFGSFASVAALGATSTPTRVIGSGPRAGTVFPVDVPTHVATIAQFEAGAVSQSVLSFDAQLQRQGFFEVYGTEGTLSIPDPNRFEGHIQLARAPQLTGFTPDYEIEWTELPQKGVRTGRGLGVLDMARSISEERPHVASGELGNHVLDALVSAEESITSGQFVSVASSIDPVPRLPDNFDPFKRTL